MSDAAGGILTLTFRQASNVLEQSTFEHAPCRFNPQVLTRSPPIPATRTIFP